MKIHSVKFVLLIITIFSSLLMAQEENDTLSRIQNSPSEQLRKDLKDFKLKGKYGFFLMGGYSFGLNDQTSANGIYIPKDATDASNNFYVKYARINGAFSVSPKLNANLLVNFADFKNENLSRRVLEIASVTYSMNNELNIRLGQFRPYFGIEDTYGIATHKSNAWSNSYYLLGRSNWQSFQLGASIYGDLRDKNIPFKYYVNVYNGNGRNRVSDNNSNKNLSSRVVLTVIPNVEIGANYAIAKHLDENVNAATFDFKSAHLVSNKIAFNTEFSYAFGHNVADAISNSAIDNQIDDYKFRGWYFIPQIVYKLDRYPISIVEFSCRYEALYGNLDLNKNRWTTITPMIAFVINDNFEATIASIINTFDKADKSLGIDNTQWLQIQLQFNY